MGIWKSMLGSVRFRNLALPEDIRKSQLIFRDSLLRSSERLYILLRDTGHAGRNLSDQLAQLLRQLGEYHEYLNEWKEVTQFTSGGLNPICT